MTQVTLYPIPVYGKQRVAQIECDERDPSGLCHVIMDGLTVAYKRKISQMKGVYWYVLYDLDDGKALWKYKAIRTGSKP